MNEINTLANGSPPDFSTTVYATDNYNRPNPTGDFKFFNNPFSNLANEMALSNTRWDAWQLAYEQSKIKQPGVFDSLTNALSRGFSAFGRAGGNLGFGLATGAGSTLLVVGIVTLVAAKVLGGGSSKRRRR